VQQFKIAEAKLAHARANLNLLKAGAWKPELAAAQAGVAKAEAELDQTRTGIERLTIRARTDARILQVNIHPGEFVTAFSNQSLVVMGSTRELHVRVDIDENDIPRFHEGGTAVAMLKGKSRSSIPLEFIRVHPFVIPKVALTGENTERVDTRVLPVIYAIRETTEKLYVGQQLDVFIEAE
jgi:multidrug resistance efflux pump